MGFGANQEENIANYGSGMGGFGGSWCIIIVFFVIAWLLFKDGHRDGYDGHRDGFRFGDGCGPCVQPTFKDESNFEEERNINAKLCCIDKDVWENGCKDREATHYEGEKTRALIEQNYIQDLRDTITEKNSMIQTMKSEAFTAAQIGMVNNKIEKVDEMIERLACELPKRPPVWSECVTPCAVELPERCSPRRRRERCEDDCF